MKERKAAGEIRKMVAMDGHKGPKEINVQPEFLDWLTDPVRNGGGALFDFGCYGANLMTWLMDNQRPLAVTAVTQQNKPAIYPRVDDEATILVEYPKRAGHHPGVVELAVRPEGLRGLRRARATRSRPAATACASRCRTSRKHAVTPDPLPPDEQRLDFVPDRRRARHAQAERPVVAREQPHRDRDPRRPRASRRRAGRAVQLADATH